MAKSSDAPTDWEAIELPDNNDYETWDTDERRAALYRAILRAGGPTRINQRRFADRFGVHPSTITRDKRVIAEDVAQALREAGADGLALEVKAAYNRIFTELMDAGEYIDAWRIVDSWSSWLADVGAVHQEPTRHEVTTKRDSETDSYVVLDGDGEPLSADDVAHAPVRPGEEFRVDGDLE